MCTPRTHRIVNLTAAVAQPRTASMPVAPRVMGSIGEIDRRGDPVFKKRRLESGTPGRVCRVGNAVEPVL